MITLYHVTSHQSKSDVSFSSQDKMTPPSRPHLQSEAHAAMSFTEAVSLTKFELLQHTGRAVCKKKKEKKKTWPVQIKLQMHSHVHNHSSFLSICSQWRARKKPCFYSNLQWPGCFQGRLHGHQPLRIVQYEFRCASFYLNRKYECHTEKRGWFNSLQ